MKKLPLLNFVLLFFLAIALYFLWNRKPLHSFGEIKAERLSIVGPDGHLYISISNPERQALVTHRGKVMDTSVTNRDLPGLIFFNRLGDEVGGIYYDGDEKESFQGITFDQQDNDQVMVISKQEYLEDDKWQRFYGMYFRDRKDSIRNSEYYAQFKRDTVGLKDSLKQVATKNFYDRLWTEIDVYRMFLGRYENRETGLFIHDTKGRERIKIFVDSNDLPQILVLDTLGQQQDLIRLK
ncbi:MAG: hypothetical protein AAGC45_04365 [Bacteroidota bacterium]